MNQPAWQVAGLTDKGHKREENQDNFLISDDNHLAVVADGMGGHNFSTGLKEHNQNVNVYRKARNEEKREAASGLNARQKSEMIIRPGQ